MTNNCFFRVNHNFHRSSEKHCKEDPFQKATAANVNFKYRLDLCFLLENNRSRLLLMSLVFFFSLASLNYCCIVLCKHLETYRLEPSTPLYSPFFCSLIQKQLQLFFDTAC